MNFFFILISCAWPDIPQVVSVPIPLHNGITFSFASSCYASLREFLLASRSSVACYLGSEFALSGI